MFEKIAGKWGLLGIGIINYGFLRIFWTTNMPSTVEHMQPPEEIGATG